MITLRQEEKSSLMFGSNRNQHREDNAPSFLKSLVSMAITFCLLFFGYQYVTGKKSISASFPSFKQSSSKFNLKYRPIDFQYPFDDDYTLKVISEPEKFRKEFNNFIYDYNMSLITHVGKRMGFQDSLQTAARDTYNEHHGYLKKLYYNDFIQLKDPNSKFYQDWYEADGSQAVEAFKEVSSKYTCFIINHVLTSIIHVQKGMIEMKGKDITSPCGIAVQEAINPMLNRLKEKAAIDDFLTSKGMLSEKIEEAVAELGTYEIRDKKGLSKSLKTKVMGYNVSSTDVEIMAVSIIKVGFKLDEYFDIKMMSKTKKLVVSLPAPAILSHEVYPKIDKLDIGWMRELKKEDFNKNINLLREAFRQDIDESDAFSKSKVKVKEIMAMLLSPILHNGYTLDVRFIDGLNATVQN